MAVSSFSPFSISRIITLGVLSLFASTVFAQDRTTEAGMAAIKDPVAECTQYGLPVVFNNLSKFPPAGVATLVAGDSTAAAKWASIQGGVPNIAVKAGFDGDLSKIPYSNAEDPDCWWSNSNCVTPKAPGLHPDVSNVPEPRTLGYGFDDGPNCSHNAFYDYLQQQNQKATMFYIGINVLNWPLQAQRAATDGHEICVHTWSHSYMTSLTNEQAFAELYYTVQAIQLVMNVTPTCWRPPYGDVDDRIRAIAQGLGLSTILWEFESNDWQVGSVNFPQTTPQVVDSNYQNLTTAASTGKLADAGAIILTHELNDFTMSEAMRQYPALLKAFDHIVPVGVALNLTGLPSFADYTSGRPSQALPVSNTPQPNSAPAAPAAAPASGSQPGPPPASPPKSSASSPVSSPDTSGNAAPAATTSNKSGASGLHERMGLTLPAALVLLLTGSLMMG